MNMDSKTCLNGPNLNVRKIPCIPLMSTSTINIHLPLSGSTSSGSSQSSAGIHQISIPLQMSAAPPAANLNQNHRTIHYNLGSQGSSTSTSTSQSRSASSSRSSPPSTPLKRQVSLQLADEAFETDSAMGSSQEDSRSIQSFNSETSSMGIGVDNEETQIGHSVAAIYMDREVALMVKVVCQSESTCTEPRFLKTLLDIIKACGLSQRKETTGDEFSTVTVNKTKLSDGRPIKEHLSEVCRELSNNITICEAVFRRRTDNRQYVGTFVHDVLKAEGCCTLARVGVLVTLTKCNKIAPAREFADQLCEHIMTTKPNRLGYKAQALEMQKLKTQQKEIRDFHVHRDELLSQIYIFDPTINVAEAARRSFVEVSSFYLFE